MAEMNPAASDSRAKPPPTLRVTFAYRGRELQLAAAERVAMIAPPAITPVPARGQSGYWLEVRDRDGTLLFHRALHSPIRVDAEVYSYDARQSIARIPVAESEGEFEVLVPDAPEASALSIWGPPADVGLQAEPSRELIEVSYDALRRAAASDGGGAAR